MKWEMDTEEVEAVLERIWDLHDKVSDAIHAISRSHFLTSIKTRRPSTEGKPPPGGGNDGRGAGFVFVKDFARAEDDAAAMAEARSLNGIRSALENLEDQLEFFHTVQSQQRAERDAAIARLEQSRIILAMRLADHQGKKYKVIEEALAFVGDARGTGCFVAPENLYENLDDREGKRPGVLMQMLISSFELAKTSIKLERFGGVLGNAALFAVSMLALLQLQQVTFKCDNTKAQQKKLSLHDNSRSIQLKNFDVFSARG